MFGYGNQCLIQHRSFIVTKGSIERIGSRNCRIYTGWFKSSFAPLRTNFGSGKWSKSLCTYTHTHPNWPTWLVRVPPLDLVLTGAQGQIITQYVPLYRQNAKAVIRLSFLSACIYTMQCYIHKMYCNWKPKGCITFIAVCALLCRHNK